MTLNVSSYLIHLKKSFKLYSWLNEIKFGLKKKIGFWPKKKENNYLMKKNT